MTDPGQGTAGLAAVPDRSVSVIRGMPIGDEPGIGALTLAGFIREVTSRYGPREAVVQPISGGGAERWTYDDLWQRTMAVARSLVAVGTAKGARVGILMTNRAEFLPSVFGAALAGAVATPLSTFSTAEELDHLLTTSACSVLIFERRVLKKDFAEMIVGLEPAVTVAEPGNLVSRRYPFLRQIVALDSPAAGAIETWSDFLARGRAIEDAVVDARSATVSAGDPGALFFSSGTTGKPKGILSAHRGVAIQLWRWKRIFALHDGVRCWSANGFFWSGPFSMTIGGALGSGGSLVMQSIFDPEAALTLMASERVEFPMGWPHQWAQLSAAANWNEVDLSSLRFVAPDNPLGQHPTVNTDWHQPTRTYGNTETFTISSTYPSGTPEALIGDSWGFPLPGMTFKICDPLSGGVVPMGERGEIAVKGPTLMLSYVGVPPDQTLDDEGYYRTGDGGYVDEQGRLYWEGRLNDIIKTGGANVSPVEIDGVLVNCPGVKRSQTVGVPDDLLGELVVACIVCHEGATLDEDMVRIFARAHLASYKVPRRVLFFRDDELSLTGSAKIKTAELANQAAAMLAAEEKI